MKEYLSNHPKLIAVAIFILFFVWMGLCIAYPAVFVISVGLLMLSVLSYLVWDMSRHAAVKIARRLRR